MDGKNKREKTIKFWAESIADRIIERKKFRFTEEKIPKLKKWSLKSSSSISGVLHVGRLSDLIRSEAVFKALEERKFPVDFIYVTEDMDPLRKIPEGVPSSFQQYIGFSVSDIPDPFGCHKTYAEHFMKEFLQDVQKFLSFNPKMFSMREEYKKGSFTDSIMRLVENSQEILGIINQFKQNKEEGFWIPWKPICDNCGNLQTTQAVRVEGSKVHYKCVDYAFEHYTAKGCDFEGVSDLRKGNGKLVWKSEWAAQWKRWNVCSEGAGKEYESRNSAFWINAEICERTLCFPMPEPIFYEHLMVDGKKMSASIGNVVYPKQWLECSRPETLRLLFLKRLGKARSFSWNEIPVLELELDRLSESKDKEQKKFSNFVSIKSRKLLPLRLDYSLALLLSQLFDEKQAIEKAKELGVISKKTSKKELGLIKERLSIAKSFSEKHLPEEERIVFLEQAPSLELASQVKKALAVIALELSSLKTDDAIQAFIFNTAKAQNTVPKQLFQSIYQALIGKKQGPKAGSLIIALGKEKVAKRLKELS